MGVNQYPLQASLANDGVFGIEDLDDDSENSISDQNQIYQVNLPRVPTKNAITNTADRLREPPCTKM